MKDRSAANLHLAYKYPSSVRKVMVMFHVLKLCKTAPVLPLLTVFSFFLYNTLTNFLDFCSFVSSCTFHKNIVGTFGGN